MVSENKSYLKFSKILKIFNILVRRDQWTTLDNGAHANGQYCSRSTKDQFPDRADNESTKSFVELSVCENTAGDED